LRAPEGRDTRPTTDRVREAAFSMLASLGAVAGAQVWDLFAGSGALGIEALSRGADHVIFVDSGRRALGCIRANLAELGYGPDRATVVGSDVLSWLGAGPGAGGGKKVDLVLADPPYSFVRWQVVAERIHPFSPWLLAETAIPPELGPGWAVIRQKRYGTTVVTVGRPAD
jgi:16S rRNA (guanine966-N2)-methyltransferase